jgi:hypothetical protein
VHRVNITVTENGCGIEWLLKLKQVTISTVAAHPAPSHLLLQVTCEAFVVNGQQLWCDKLYFGCFILQEMEVRSNSFDNRLTAYNNLIYWKSLVIMLFLLDANTIYYYRILNGH